MDAGWIDLLYALALGTGLAACAGLRAWLPLLLAGAAARLGWIDVGSSFEFISSTRALLIFAAATVIETAADKIPAVDHVLDALSTVVRPAAGSLLAASVLWPVSDPIVALCLGVAVGAPTALVPHAAKSLLRATSSSVTAGIANPVISVVEDVAAVVLFMVAVVLPLLALATVIGVLICLVSRWRKRPAMVALS